MNSKLKGFIRAHCPNIPLLRKSMTKIKIRNILKYSLDEEDIVKGERSAEDRNNVVAECVRKWPESKAMLHKAIDQAVANARKAGDVEYNKEICKDIFFNYYAYGFMPDEYFSFHLFGKSGKEKNEFISDRERLVFAYELNDIIDLEIFHDKFRTYQKFSEFFKRKAICIQKQEDLPAFEEFAKKYTRFVKKPVRFSRGSGIALVDMKEFSSPKEAFDSILKDGKTVLEELVVQTEEMARLNSSSVNTVRIPTFLTDNGPVVGPCRCRVGHEGAFVDNAGAGGILIGVDNKTGKLSTDGWDEYCRSYDKHPDNGLTFKGYQLPEWDRLVDTVKKMAALMPSIRYISWDMAHTKDGWIVIEGNGTGQFIGSQIVEQRGMKSEVFSLFNK